MEQKENTIHIAQFGGYDIKTTVTYKDGKVTDLQIKGENFEGKYAEENKISTFQKRSIKSKTRYKV